MKKSDIAMIILIASVSMMVAYFVVSAIPGLKDAGKPVTVKTAEKIEPKVDDPDPTVFNQDAINPTVKITIGDDSAGSSQ